MSRFVPELQVCEILGLLLLDPQDAYDVCNADHRPRVPVA